jgi:1-aminocyclopropane-1-carboxylate deaminase/D-cysteine desulfhydrase-like pyridoxal-dependent ACC family enzyme
MNYSPSPVVSKIDLGNKKIFSVRDDLLVGGTKQRAAVPYIEKLIEEGHRHFIYASPFSGFAQVALAYACKELGVDCTLFCEKDNDSLIHEFSMLAQSHGANIVLCETLADASMKSQDYASLNHGVMLIPLGFNDPHFKNLLKREISKHWDTLKADFKIVELWLPIGSGTLLSVFKEVVGPRVKLNGVNVNVLPDSDARIKLITGDSNITYFQSRQKFHEPCINLPPIPSNLYYDAKLFDFLEAHASDGAFWWNVAR